MQSEESELYTNDVKSRGCSLKKLLITRKTSRIAQVIIQENVSLVVTGNYEISRYSKS